jgi:hypothetical protein
MIQLLDDPTSREPGDLDEFERWWVERQEAFERADTYSDPASECQ